MIGRLNHVALAVPNLAQAAERYRTALGASVSEPQSLPEHGVTVVFIELDNTKIELLEPLGDDSPIAAFLAKNPRGGMHHVCYEVSDLRAAGCWRAGRGCLATASPRSARMAGRCFFFIPRTCSGH